MKERLLVMNGQRIVQAEKDGAWTNQKVDKAGALKPGIYNLYTAQAADKKQTHAGVIVHADATNVYQQIGRTLSCTLGQISIKYLKLGAQRASATTPRARRQSPQRPRN